MSKSKKIIIISLLSAVLLLIIIASCVLLLIDEKTSVNISTSESTLKESADYGQHYINNMIFLGDESIYGLISSGVLEGGIETRQVWSGKDGSLPLDYNIDNATIIFPQTQEEMLITQALKEQHPRYLIITVGAQNGVQYCDKEAFTDYYKKLISAVKKSSPDTNIILQSIFPVTAMQQLKDPELSNEKINRCNDWICQIAEEENIKFLNTSEYLKNRSGNLHKDYVGNNGISLSVEGYKAMIAYMRTHGYTYPNAETEPPTEPVTEEST